MKPTIYVLIGATALASASASAQSPLPSAGKVVSDLAAGATGGMTPGDKATSKMELAKSLSSEIMSSNLVGATVYNNQNESIGKIEDLAIANGKSIAGVVVGVGGFLGIGDSYVLVRPSSFAVKSDGGTIKVFLNATKDTLKNAPKFKYDRKS